MKSHQCLLVEGSSGKGEKKGQKGTAGVLNKFTFDFGDGFMGMYQTVHFKYVQHYYVSIITQKSY